MTGRKLAAIYIDLGNVSGIVSLKRLFESVILEDSSQIESEQQEIAFVIKEAYGRSESINPIRSELIEYNFDIHETPHQEDRVFKNRADLMISVAAFETVYVNNPNVDVYIFVSTDSDFSVIMDKLRKYGKEVWLFARRDTVNLGGWASLRITDYAADCSTSSPSLNARPLWTSSNNFQPTIRRHRLSAS